MQITRLFEIKPYVALFTGAVYEGLLYVIESPMETTPTVVTKHFKEQKRGKIVVLILDVCINDSL